MTLGDRIKKVRKEMDLTQQVFCNKIGLKRNSISLVESGKRNISDQAIKSICREFHVSETWLRTGEGEMFDQTEQTALDKLCAELHASELEAGIIRAYFRIDSRIREPFMQRLIQEMQKEYAVPAQADTLPRHEKNIKDWTEADIDADVAEYRQNLLREKEQAEKLSVSTGSSKKANLA